MFDFGVHIKAVFTCLPVHIPTFLVLEVAIIDKEEGSKTVNNGGRCLRATIGACDM